MTHGQQNVKFCPDKCSANLPNFTTSHTKFVTKTMDPISALNVVRISLYSVSLSLETFMEEVLFFFLNPLRPF